MTPEKTGLKDAVVFAYSTPLGHLAGLMELYGGKSASSEKQDSNLKYIVVLMAMLIRGSFVFKEG